MVLVKVKIQSAGGDGRRYTLLNRILQLRKGVGKPLKQIRSETIKKKKRNCYGASSCTSGRKSASKTSPKHFKKK